jgi:hypothetical protein
VLGYSLKWAAYLYIRRYTLQAGGKVLPRAINVTPSGIKLFAPSGQPPAGVSTTIKSSAPGVSGPTGTSGQLHAGFDPRGVQSRVTGAAAAASGGSPVPGMSPLPSPKGNGPVPGLLAGQLPMPVGVFNSSSSSSSSGRALTPPVGISSSSSQQAAGAGPLSYPGLQHHAGTSGLGQVAYAGLLPVGNAAGDIGSGMQSGHMQVSPQAYVLGSGSTIDSSTSKSSAQQRLLAATLAANSAPPAASSELLLSDSLTDDAAGHSGAGMGPSSQPAEASAAAAAGTAAAGGAGAEPSLQTLSMPPRLGLSRADRTDSGPGSPSSAGSQLQRPVMDWHVPARASCSDARPGWDAESTADSLALQAGGGTLADSMFASKEAPAAMPAGPVMVAGGSDSAGGCGAAIGAVAGAAAQGAGVSSSYSEVSAAGLAARGQQKYVSVTDMDTVQQQHRPQRHAEQEWQQPKGRHRAKRE